MPQIRVKPSTKVRLEKLAERLLGAPGVETAKHAGIVYVPADQVLSVALAILETELDRRPRARRA